jgi:hypothetical protein
MAESTHSYPTESALVVEDGDAQRIQAQFTRLQMALGLKKSLSGEGKIGINYLLRLLINVIS